MKHHLSEPIVCQLRLEDQIFLPVEQRLLLTLFRQAGRHGERCADGSVVLHLIQKDLAHLIGASRETVAELLATYKKRCSSDRLSHNQV